MIENPTTTTTFVRSEYLTIGELASNLGWSPRFIEGLVRGERLPALEMDGVFHFRRDDVIDWLAQKIQTLDTSRVRQLESRVEASLVEDGTYRRPLAIDRLASRLPAQGIALDVHITSKLDVLKALVGLAERTGLLYDSRFLLASLLDREAVCSTAMPGGIALCHPRRPVPSAISTQFVCLLRTVQPVDFDAPDGEGTSIFFLLCAPDDRSHLYGLARVARLLHNGLLAPLREAKDEAAVKQAVVDVENLVNASTA